MKSFSALAFDFKCLLLVPEAYYSRACDTLRERASHPRYAAHINRQRIQWLK